MADQYPVTLAEFRAWLETKRPTAVVGERGSPLACPIACYLGARGDGDVEVSGVEIGRFSDMAVYSAPAWVGDFVKLVDDNHAVATIQARTALRLLDRVAHASLPAEDDWERTALETEALT